jgi:FkbM family methyltransferase
MSVHMISYAQNFEDVVLGRVFHSCPCGRYVDIGAYDPVVDSVTKHFYDRGWSGVNVEPVARFHRKFSEARPRDWNLNAVVGAADGTVEFVEWGDSGLSGYRQLFDSADAERLGFRPSTSTLPMMSLASITRQLPPGDVEFLKVDVEGAERDVLAGADWSSFRPRVVVVEAIRPNLSLSAGRAIEPMWHEWEGILLANGYEFALFDGLNRFYYRREEPQLRERLSYPANVTDGFALHPGHFLRRQSK